MPYQITL